MEVYRDSDIPRVGGDHLFSHDDLKVDRFPYHESFKREIEYPERIEAMQSDSDFWTSLGLRQEDLAGAGLGALNFFDFDSPPLEDDVMVVTCRRVWEGGNAVRYVSHEEDDCFQFLCGRDEHTSSDEVLYMHAGHILDREPDQVRDFIYPRKGCCARLLSDGKWHVAHLPPEGQ